jgi:AcrR family transcriptional regulator
MVEKEKQILAAALQLFVAFGFHGTPTSKIAARAGVSNGTLFHYYKTKEELVVALYNDSKADLAAYLSAQMGGQDSLETRFKKSFVHSLYWALDNPEKFYYIQQFHFSPHLAQVSPEVIAEQSRMHRQLIGEGIQAKLLKPLPVDLLFTLISSQVYGLYQYLTAPGFPADQRHAVIEEAFALLWRMIKK